ncbi:MAG: ABC transporter substrate-binding protein, partial [Thermodesulfobacteriota bacterium]
MKVRSIAVICGVLSLLLILVGVTSTTALAEEQPYKVGCNLELSGPLAGLIAFIKNGLILEQEAINAQGGIDGHKLELVFEDNAMDITKAANINTKFARDKEIMAI